LVPGKLPLNVLHDLIACGQFNVLNPGVTLLSFLFRYLGFGNCGRLSFQDRLYPRFGIVPLDPANCHERTERIQQILIERRAGKIRTNPFHRSRVPDPVPQVASVDVIPRNRADGNGRLFLQRQHHQIPRFDSTAKRPDLPDLIRHPSGRSIRIQLLV